MIYVRKEEKWLPTKQLSLTNKRIFSSNINLVHTASTATLLRNK